MCESETPTKSPPEYVEYHCGACCDEGFIEFCVYCDCAAGEKRRDADFTEDVVFDNFGEKNASIA